MQETSHVISMALHFFFLEILLFSFTVSSSTVTTTATMAKPGCRDMCGNLSIPYPFGIGKNCYLNEWYEMTCDTNIPRLRNIKVGNASTEVLAIELAGAIIIKGPILSTNCTKRAASNYNMKLDLGEGSPFSISPYNKIMTVVGCNNITGVSISKSTLNGCEANCTSSHNGEKSICQTRDPESPQIFDQNALNIFSDIANERCVYAFLIYYDMLDPSGQMLDMSTQTVPVLLWWGISETEKDLYFPLKAMSNENGSVICGNFSATINLKDKLLYCLCNPGYDGNPYITYNSGCQDIDECADHSEDHCPGKWLICKNTQGSYKCLDKRLMPVLVGFTVPTATIIGLLGSWWFYKTIRRRKSIKLKASLFKELLSEQQQSLSDGNAPCSPKLFKERELNKATNNFNENRIMGEGGQGTIYKGMLEDGKVIAVERTNFADGGKVRQFINEIVSLSQVNHRNVVKLLGCCLETDASLLVYEYVTNGTLFQHIHSQNDEFQLTWEARLQIALGVAEGLAYLHSGASLPIYHRDVKSANILLDEKLRAKISYFGTSRSVSMDQTHLTTVVQGTFGYMDPEYFQSGQFTEKSDVYSFGVVLVELLTGLEPTKTHRDTSAVEYFLHHFEEDHLLQILDARVLRESDKEDILAVASIAKRCLLTNGNARPTMRIVAAELQRIRTCEGASVKPGQQDFEFAETQSESQSLLG